MTNRTMIRLGAVLAAIAVVTGAVAAHGIDWEVAGRKPDRWDTAAQYHMYHALGLVIAGCLRKSSVAAVLFVAGIVLFSGSLYVIALGGPTWLGAITPIGGLAFIGAWLMVAWRA